MRRETVGLMYAQYRADVKHAYRVDRQESCEGIVAKYIGEVEI